MKAFNRVKPRDYATTKDVVGRAIDEVRGVKSAAFLLGLGTSQVQAFADPQTTQEISYDRMRRLTISGASAAAEDLAALAGGVFVPLEPGEGCLAHHAAETARHYGEFVAAVMSGLNDGDLCAAEREACLKEIDDVQRALAGARAALTGHPAG